MGVDREFLWGCLVVGGTGRTRRGRTTCGVKCWEGEEAIRHPKERSREGRLVDIFRRDWIGNISKRWSVLLSRGDMYKKGIRTGNCLHDETWQG